MNNYKIIESVLPPPPPHMVGNGFRVHNFLPGNLRDTARMSPFFLLDYNARIDLPPSDVPRGVGVHPHRGFETVTIAYHGKVAHHDSAGNSGLIGEGDIQWMTAASGVLHKEYQEEKFNRQGGLFQMVQIWINLPAKDKMSKPKYQALTHDQLGKFELKDDAGEVNVIAGSFNGIPGPASTFTPIQMYDARLKNNSVLEMEFPENYNTGILILEGKVMLNESEIVPVDHFVYFRNKGTSVRLEALENSIVLVLSGEPIDEPTVQYGPFLMNTQAQIQQAVNDFNSGKFGHLED
jgi:quercetin 2,3-dioxygenase